MARRLGSAILLLAGIGLFAPLSQAQTTDEQVQPPLILESPPPILPNVSPDEPSPPDDEMQEQTDMIRTLGQLRDRARTMPDDAGARRRLARALYLLGDLDAAIDECRIAVKLQPDNARSHLQLGAILMAKQDWRAASSVLKEAIRLDQDLAQAHYSLGTAQYSLGQVKAAIQSYRQALVLQPHFPDARYRLALLLKLTSRDREAAQLMEEAAQGGLPQAQFFLGNAYKNGQGVDRDLAKAVWWWSTAVDLGHQPAAEALSKLRRQALSPAQPDRRRNEALEAFRVYREKLWEEFSEYHPEDVNETLGTTLFRDDRTDVAVSVLLKEGYALSETAQNRLAVFYETGWDGHLAPFAKKILACFETTAADGFLPAKKILARIYARGLGTVPDLQKAKALLKGLPKQEIQALLDTEGSP